MPSATQGIIDFENVFLELVKNVTFRKVNNNFQDQVIKDIKSIRKSNNIFIFVDKTRNLYIKLANCSPRT